MQIYLINSYSYAQLALVVYLAPRFTNLHEIVRRHALYTRLHFYRRNFNLVSLMFKKIIYMMCFYFLGKLPQK